jgi:FkbM family methyltransferase
MSYKKSRLSIDLLPEISISKQLIGAFLPLNPAIIEAGAHIGRDTIKMSKLWPQGIIYAFEPIPELFTLLKQNTKNYSNIFCYNTALSDKNGSALMHVSSGRSTACSSLLKPKECLSLQPNVLFEHEIEVPLCTLDTWAQRAFLTHCDFLWLDVQGNELKVLEASTTLLTNTKALLIEINLIERYQSNPSFDDIEDFVIQYNFKALLRDTTKHNKTNVLFTKIS